MVSTRLARIFQGVGLSLLIPVTAAAQTTGTLRGIVVDVRGEPLAGVSITVVSASQGVTGRGAVTDRRGSFQIASLPLAADYSVRATLPGYAGVVLPDAEISAVQVITVRILLQPEEAFKEQVEVRSRPQVLTLASPLNVDGVRRFGRRFQLGFQLGF